MSAALRARVAAAYAALGVARPAVAVSGGLDSSVLARLTADALPACAFVYVDHGLRPATADEARFVEALARTCGVRFRAAEAPLAPGNVQAAARAARYAALGAAAHALGCDAVATAHTADDQAETLLLALVRGAGLRGLAGMAPARPLAPGSALRLVRPLLDAERAELDALARAEGWTWCEDASNAGDAYRRNRIRHHVLPALRQEGGPGTARRLAEAAAAARAALDDVGPARRLAELGTPDARGGWIGTAALAGLAPPARRALWAEALSAWTAGPRSATLVARVDELLDADPGRRVDAGGWVAWRDRHRVRLVAPEPAPAPVAVPAELPWTLEHAWGTLRATGAVAEREAGALDVDAARLAGAALRPWRAGERLQIDGRARRVAELLDARRVPPSERLRQLVLAVGDEVLWLVGAPCAATASAPADPAHGARLTWTPRHAPTPDRPGAGVPREAPRP